MTENGSNLKGNRIEDDYEVAHAGREFWVLRDEGSWYIVQRTDRNGGIVFDGYWNHFASKADCYDAIADTAHEAE